MSNAHCSSVCCTYSQAVKHRDGTVYVPGPGSMLAGGPCAAWHKAGRLSTSLLRRSQRSALCLLLSPQQMCNPWHPSPAHPAAPKVQHQLQSRSGTLMCIQGHKPHGPASFRLFEGCGFKSHTLVVFARIWVHQLQQNSSAGSIESSETSIDDITICSCIWCRSGMGKAWSSLHALTGTSS